MGKRSNLILHTDTKRYLKKVREIAQALVLNPTGYIPGAVVCVPPFYTLKSQFDLNAETAETLGMANTDVDIPTELKSLVTKATLSCSPVKVKQFGSLKKTSVSSGSIGYGSTFLSPSADLDMPHRSYPVEAEEDYIDELDGLGEVDVGDIAQEAGVPVQDMNALIQQEYDIAAQEQEQEQGGGFDDALSLQQLASDDGPHHPYNPPQPQLADVAEVGQVQVPSLEDRLVQYGAPSREGPTRPQISSVNPRQVVYRGQGMHGLAYEAGYGPASVLGAENLGSRASNRPRKPRAVKRKRS